MLAEKVRHTKWLDDIENEYSCVAKFISTIFLGTEWKEEVRHWRSLEGYEKNVHK